MDGRGYLERGVVDGGQGIERNEFTRSFKIENSSIMAEIDFQISYETNSNSHQLESTNSNSHQPEQRRTLHFQSSLLFLLSQCRRMMRRRQMPREI